MLFNIFTMLRIGAVIAFTMIPGYIIIKLLEREGY